MLSGITPFRPDAHIATKPNQFASYSHPKTLLATLHLHATSVATQVEHFQVGAVAREEIRELADQPALVEHLQI